MSRPSFNGDGEAPTPPMGGTPGPTTGTQGPPAEGFGIGTYGGAGGAEDGTVRVEIGTPDGMNDFNMVAEPGGTEEAAGARDFVQVTSPIFPDNDDQGLTEQVERVMSDHGYHDAIDGDLPGTQTPKGAGKGTGTDEIKTKGLNVGKGQVAEALTPDFMRNIDAFLTLLGAKAKEKGVGGNGGKTGTESVTEVKKSVDFNKVQLDEKYFRRMKTFDGTISKFKEWNFDLLVTLGKVEEKLTAGLKKMIAMDVNKNREDRLGECDPVA